MADLLGVRIWTERRLFELLGSWVTTTVEPAAKLHLAEASRRHGWHAQVWFDRMPQLSSLDPEARVVAGDERLAELFDVFDVDADSVPADALTAVRLDGVVRVLLPRLVVAYRTTLDGLGAAADASVARWSRLLLVDDLDEWERGEALLQELILTPAQLDAVTAQRRRAEALLLGSSPIPI